METVRSAAEITGGWLRPMPPRRAAVARTQSVDHFEALRSGSSFAYRAVSRLVGRTCGSTRRFPVPVSHG